MSQQQFESKMKEEAIRLIANSKCFMILADDGKTLERRGLVNNTGTALGFLREIKTMEHDILFPKKQDKTPAPSNIVT